MTEVVVAGAGLAGLTCAYLLAAQGRPVRVTGWQPDARERAPDTGGARPRWLVLNELTVAVLRDVWDGGAGLFEDAWPIRHRHVRWGGSATTRRLEQPSLAVDGSVLVRRLGARLAEAHPDLVRFTPDGLASPPAAWLVTAAAPPPGRPARPVELGRRNMISAEVRLAPAEPTATSRLVAAGSAWVFLAPIGERQALVQAMVPGPVARPVPLLHRLLAETALGARLTALPETVVVVPAAPRFLQPPCGPGWFAVGGTAARFDPLSGSGVVHAVCTAILAAAAIEAIDRGADERDVRAHVTARVLTAFFEHVRTCLGLYTSALDTSDPDTSALAATAWRDEIDTMAGALRRFGAAPPPSFGFTLVDRHLVAHPR
ncbi:MULTISPECIES: hypothetical protein [unclassified Frankia]